MRLPWKDTESSTSEAPQRKYPNSLLKRFSKAILLLYLVSVIVSIPAIYAVTNHQLRAAADKELSLLVDMVTAVRKYIADDVRGDLMAANLFHSPAISSTVTTSRVAKHFREMRPDYYIKVASDNPLNQNNKPEPLEWEVLDRFRGDDGLDRIVEIGDINDRQYLVSSRPSRAKKGCLVCHGEPDAAPDAIKAKYGTTEGYHYRVGGVVGAIVVGVPIADVNALVMDRSLFALGILTLIFAVIFITVSGIVRRQIVEPVENITDIAVAISTGNLGRKVDVYRDGSEIGELGHAMQLVQRSLAFAMKKIRR
jgi:protein-histidine pros-kinase